MMGDFFREISRGGGQETRNDVVGPHSRIIMFDFERNDDRAVILSAILEQGKSRSYPTPVFRASEIGWQQRLHSVVGWGSSAEEYVHLLCFVLSVPICADATVLSAECCK